MNQTTATRTDIHTVILALMTLATVFALCTTFPANAQDRPNVLFAIADDWSWPHASAYGAPEVHTPHFDRIAAEGALFTNAFTAAPQCSPNRAALLTGRHIWQLEEAGTHASIFPDKFPVFTDALEDSGYHIGFTQKGWSPGDWKRGGWDRNPAGPAYNNIQYNEVPADGMKKTNYPANFEAFLDDREDGEPFFFWYGASEPHRGYEEGSGVKAGKDLDNIDVPPFLPDTELVRSDIADYFLEVEWFDQQLGKMLAILEDRGDLGNTIVVVTGDNGMPFPRAKANLYEYGVHVPLAIRWPGVLDNSGTIDAIISFIDFAPTFLEIAGLDPLEGMTGRSFVTLLQDEARPAHRAFALTGRERHTHARYDNLGYPSRAIRTQDYLYIRNFKPDRWPAGQPDGYEDIDGSPTLDSMRENKDEYPRLWDLSVGKRPAEELYAIKDDPGCMKNLADDTDRQAERVRLSEQLLALLAKQGDPRAFGKGDIFESYPRVSHMRPHLGGFAERGKYNPKYAPGEE